MGRVTLPVLALCLVSGCSVDDLSDYYPDRCEVHGKALRGDTVRVGYGLPAKIGMADWVSLAKARFPYAERYMSGGCCPPMGFRFAEFARIKYCADCRRAEARTWRREGPDLVARHYPGARGERLQRLLRSPP
jgi:hypothetical protein